MSFVRVTLFMDVRPGRFAKNPQVEPEEVGEYVKEALEQAMTDEGETMLESIIIERAEAA